MRRTSRLFELIQLLRAADQPLTSEQLAAALEVSQRTVYRDIAALQAIRTPIEGAAGLGYVLRAGYDLPPLNFDLEEIEALRGGFRHFRSDRIYACDPLDSFFPAQSAPLRQLWLEQEGWGTQESTYSA